MTSYRLLASTLVCLAALGLAACGSSSGATTEGGGSGGGGGGPTIKKTKTEELTGLGGSFISNREGSSDQKCAMEAGRGAEAIKACILAQHGPVKACYVNALVGDSELKGQIRVAFTIDSNGNVEDVALAKTTVQDGEFEKCVLKAVNAFTFPSGDTKLKLSYPFKFRSVSEE